MSGDYNTNSYLLRRGPLTSK